MVWMKNRHWNLVTAPIKAVSKKEIKEIHEKTFSLNAHFERDLTETMCNGRTCISIFYLCFIPTNTRMQCIRSKKHLMDAMVSISVFLPEGFWTDRRYWIAVLCTINWSSAALLVLYRWSCQSISPKVKQRYRQRYHQIQLLTELNSNLSFSYLSLTYSLVKC